MNERAKRLGEAIRRFEQAVRADEMRGAQRPEDQEDIKREYREALSHLANVITEPTYQGTKEGSNQ